MSLINKILPGRDIAMGETKSWSATSDDKTAGSRVTVAVGDDGVVRIDVVEWVGSDYSLVMAAELGADGKVLLLEGVSKDELAPVSEFSMRLRSIVADMKEVE